MDHTTIVAGTGEKNQYIYRFGFEILGGTFQRTEFTGDQQEGDWFIGSASFIASAGAGQQGTVLALVCTKVDGRMQCGCRDKTCKKTSMFMQNYDRAIVTGVKSIPGTEGAIRITGSDTYFGSPGSTVTLTGANFTRAQTGNDVLLDEVVQVSGVVTKNANSLAFIIPTLPVGKYALRVQNENGTSEDPVILWVTTPYAEAPIISRVTPAFVTRGGTVTLYGQGFTAENNELVTNLGSFKGLVSSDGTHITFTFTPTDMPTEYRYANGKVRHPKKLLQGKVYNTNGRSAQINLLTVEL
jgi:hypothetical protein